MDDMTNSPDASETGASATPTDASSTVAGPPDWDARKEEVYCPLCAYNLRGLTQPRCPECGYRFAWPEILDARFRLHPYLFEHHPDRNVWSFVRTLIGGLRPRRFWTSLHPAQPSRPRRLLMYWLLVVIPYILVSLVVFGMVSLAYLRTVRQWRAATIAQTESLLASGHPRITEQVATHGSVVAYVDAISPWLSLTFPQACREVLNDLVTQHVLLLAAMPLIWPCLSFLALLIFQFSMRRHRLRNIHIGRIVAYGFDIMLIPHLLLLPGLGAHILIRFTQAPPIIRLWRDVAVNWSLPIWWITVLLCFVRLWIAYKHYLRFDRPFLTVFAAHFVAGLLVLNGVLIFSVWKELPL